jgi:hypothetical protein
MMREISKVVVWTVCLSLMCVLSASAAVSTIIDTILQVPMTTVAPEIDGEMDDVWMNITRTPMPIYCTDNDPPEVWTDISSWFRVMWDEDAYYFFGHVLDDEILTDSPNDYENDSWEIYFDADKLSETTYVDGNDFQWRYVYGEAPPYPAGLGAGEWMETDYGYEFELKIDAADVPFALEADHIFGWEAQVNDRDGTERENMTKWHEPSNDSWLNPSTFGTAILTDRQVSDILDVPMTTVAPEIDGEMENAWLIAPEVSMNTYVTTEGVQVPDMTGQGDLDFTFRTMWDDDGFYFFGSVIDDIISTDSPNDYENDSFEIYFDADNLDETTYVDGNDFQWRYVYGEAPPYPAGTGTGEWMETDDGYDFELMIAAADVPFALETDHIFGWEVQVNDRENTAREHMGKYCNPTNDSWLNPSLFGTAQLVLITSVKPSAIPSSHVLVKNYPNPFNPQTTIEYQLSKPAKATLSVYNLMGEKVATMVNKAGENQFKFDSGAYELPSGVYIYQVAAGNEILTNKMMLLK